MNYREAEAVTVSCFAERMENMAVFFRREAVGFDFSGRDRVGGVRHARALSGGSLFPLAPARLTGSHMPAKAAGYGAGCSRYFANEL